MTMQRTSFLLAMLAVGLGCLTGTSVSLTAAPVNYKVPQETAAFKPGPDLAVVQGNCAACHSADYIKTQPPMKNKKEFWQAEVTKMIKVYGAPIDESDVGKIVDYLAATY
ncbi:MULTISPECIES: cytochrome c [unclassified Bradyrhizobium]|uniref:SorB family sulfite dehydrogenase c-type cytochrome subunit n=1 Tax=unclassified Bradyrhizobium TaxID=2631580 RepID=UPI0028E70B87|nr:MULTISPECIES: cytochrome c [unclassified Bradyrhizobium]